MVITARQNAILLMRQYISCAVNHKDVKNRWRCLPTSSVQGPSMRPAFNASEVLASLNIFSTFATWRIALRVVALVHATRILDRDEEVFFWVPLNTAVFLSCLLANWHCFLGNCLMFRLCKSSLWSTARLQSHCRRLARHKKQRI